MAFLFAYLFGRVLLGLFRARPRPDRSGWRDPDGKKEDLPAEKGEIEDAEWEEIDEKHRHSD